MKKLLLLLALVFLLAPKPCPAADRPCRPIWNNVVGQTYTLVLDNQHYDVVFSKAFAGPAPQGALTIYKDTEVVLKCRYTSDNDNFVYINCGADDIPFIFRNNKLELYVPSKVIMERKKVADDE